MVPLGLASRYISQRGVVVRSADTGVRSLAAQSAPTCHDRGSWAWRRPTGGLQAWRSVCTSRVVRSAGTVVPDSMTVMALENPGPASKLVPTQVPVPGCDPDAVLIKVAAAGVNRPDLLQVRCMQSPRMDGAAWGGAVCGCARGQLAAVEVHVASWDCGVRVTPRTCMLCVMRAAWWPVPGTSGCVSTPGVGGGWHCRCSGVGRDQVAGWRCGVCVDERRRLRRVRVAGYHG